MTPQHLYHDEPLGRCCLCGSIVFDSSLTTHAGGEHEKDEEDRPRWERIQKEAKEVALTESSV